eukprot:TRINITY_DN34770_c0_g1_i1.p1 TRINITY_DN34770_c0_g1~~TRINITY_DN34770_c0_g1_i1.p1  ORF type:complete len:100 (-),score=0.28 TRINITY_DN34770_c0_g1_i1:160-459(-)
MAPLYGQFLCKEGEQIPNCTLTCHSRQWGEDKYLTFKCLTKFEPVTRVVAKGPTHAAAKPMTTVTSANPQPSIDDQLRAQDQGAKTVTQSTTRRVKRMV